MSLIKEDNLDSVPIYTYRSKSKTERRTIIWEIEDMANIMAEGIQSIVGVEFQIGCKATVGGSIGNGSEPSDQINGVSKWRLQLDTVRDQPSLALILLESNSKAIYYKLSAKVLNETGTGTISPGIFAFPQEDYYYEATSWDERDKARKFTLHRQLDFGSSYTQWMPTCLGNDGTLRLKVDIIICEGYVQTDYHNGKAF